MLYVPTPGEWLYVSEYQLRTMCRNLRALTGTFSAGLADADDVRALARKVLVARHTCAYTEGGMWGRAFRPSARRFRRTMEDAKQTVRRAEIVLAALEA